MIKNRIVVLLLSLALMISLLPHDLIVFASIETAEVTNYSFVLDKEGVTRLEAEDVDVTHHVISSDNSTKIVERADASGGKFLAASTGGTINENYYFQFKFTLGMDAEIVMSAAYAQTEQKKYAAQELIKTYTYVIDGTKTIGLSSNYVLQPRDDVTKWDTVTYDAFRLAKGEHTVRVHIAASGTGNPNIDYFDFQVTKFEPGDTLMLQNFDELDEMNPVDRTGAGYTCAVTSLISEHTDAGTGLKAEWVAEGNLKAGVHTFRPNGQWVSEGFAQNAVFYTYLRFWISNPSFTSLELTVRLYEGSSNKAYFISTLGQLIRKDGTRLTVEGGNAANYGEESSMTIPSAFEGWVVFELKGNRTLGAGNGRRPINNFADVNTLEIDVRRPNTMTSGDYYVLDDICLTNSPAGTLRSLEDGDPSGDPSKNPEEKLYSGIKNIIFMIGDGMGPNQVTTARKQLNAALSMESMPISGTVCTDNILSQLTDSAAAGTALSTGIKTTNGTVAKDSDGNNVQTMLEYFAARNKLTGLVTTSYLLDATPATFGAHTLNRTNYTTIAKGFFDNDISVLLGGGTDEFSATIRDFETGENITLTNYAKQLGYKYVTDLSQLQGVKNGKVLGLFAHHYMNYENVRPATEPSIADMTEKAISLLSENEDGFFLMVESGNIDHAGHANQLSFSVADTIAFSEAVQVALDFLAENPDTLIVVTADHETGGLTEANGTYFYTTSNHSQANVPYYVAGKGADYFKNLTDNTEISFKVRQAATELDAQWVADNEVKDEPNGDPAEKDPSTDPVTDPTENPSTDPVHNESSPETGGSAIPIEAILLPGIVGLGVLATMKRKVAK
ncbi:MAG: alkaline phosphatase [Eubacteriaceae bacterium]|nr:alkaline phosphatase [Eubacteriaceae bacterium]